MDIEDIKLISTYCERKKKEDRHYITSIVKITSKNIPIRLESDDKGNVWYEVELNTLSETNFDNKDLYDLCEEGWEVNGDKFIYKL